MRYFFHFLAFAMLLSFHICVGQSNPAEKVPLKTFKKLYKINDSIYRSEQPSRKGFQLLEEKGLVSILNLRRLKDDNGKAKKTDLTLIHIRLKTKAIDEDEILQVLKAIKNAKKPLLIHCWHGSDRTGITTAAYRIVFENWTKEAAIAEFRKPEFGYHEKWYPHLVTLLENLDVARFRKELGIQE
ncbi:MAG: tyrosine-protein phosphatase [Bacteroidota bacterium]